MKSTQINVASVIDFTVGDRLLIGNEAYSISAIESATTLTTYRYSWFRELAWRFKQDFIWPLIDCWHQIKFRLRGFR